jgi:formate dehydrogenase (coenzyme F420) alpha subunit
VSKEIQSDTVSTSCRMCSYHCGLKIHLKGNKIIKVTGEKANRFSEGSLCIKGNAVKDLVYSPDRILKPLKRTKSGWKQIEFMVALDEIASKLIDVTERYGKSSLAVWKGEALGSEQERDLIHRFGHACGTPNILSNDTLCAVSKKGAIKSVFGAYTIPDIDKSRSIFIWGANPLASHYPLARKIIKARKQGLQVVLIDPRRSTFAAYADHVIMINPATDGILALGIIKKIIERGSYDREFVKKYTLGFSELAEYSSSFTPQYVEQKTGVSQAELELLTRLLTGSAPASSSMVGVGPEHHDNGFNNIRAIAAMSAICGCIDRPGGNLLPEKVPLNSLYPLPEQLVKEKPIGADRYPVFYDNHLEGHTVLALEAMITGNPSPLKAMIMTGANPVLTNPNSAKVRKALESLELFVIRDLFMTETAKYSDYFFPAASFIERSEVISYGIPQYIALTNRVFSIDHCLDEYSFFRSLALKLGLESWFPWENEDDLNRWLLEPLNIKLEELSSLPGGYQYKPFRYEKYKAEGFNTPSGKVEFVSSYLQSYGYEGLPAYKRPAYLAAEKPEEFRFTLITGGRDMRFNHSCYHNIARLKKAVPFAELEIHPEDAVKLNISNGDNVRVISDSGVLNIRALVVGEGDIKQGFLHIPHGFDDCNVNEITLDSIKDSISGFPAVKSVPVTIKKA